MTHPTPQDSLSRPPPKLVLGPRKALGAWGGSRGACVWRGGGRSWLNLGPGVLEEGPGPWLGVDIHGEGITKTTNHREVQRSGQFCNKEGALLVTPTECVRTNGCETASTAICDSFFFAAASTHAGSGSQST